MGGRQALRVGGLIPTHAGKTREALPASHDRRAHPHSRGENSFARLETQSREGSSPLTRGKPGEDTADLIEEGLIPTHAGKTQTRCYYARVP